MKFAFLRGKIQKPDGDNGSNNGGGIGKTGPIAPTRQLLPGEDNSDESDDGGVSSDAASAYRNYHKLDGNGGGRKSIFGEALRKIQAEEDGKQEEEEEDDSDDDTKEEVKVAPKKAAKQDDSEEGGGDEEDDKKEDDTSEDENLDDEVKELLSTDLAKLTGKDGKPISKKSGEFIKRMKDKLTELSKTPKPDPQLTEKLSKTEAELQRLQAIVDNELFEKSDSFKATFLDPITTGIEGLQLYFDGADDQDIPTMTKIFNEAISIANSGTKKDRVKFLKKSEELIQFMDAGPALQSQFLTEINSVFDKIQAKEEAYRQKDEGRKQFVADRLEQERAKKIGGTERALDTYVRQFTAKKQAVLDALPPKDREHYTGLYMTKAAAVKKGLSSLIVTGDVPPELATILQKGVTAEAIEHETTLAWTAYRDTLNKMKILEDENTALIKKLEKVTGEPVKDRGRTSVKSSRYDSDEGGIKRKPGESAMVFAARKNGITFAE